MTDAEQHHHARTGVPAGVLARRRSDPVEPIRRCPDTESGTGSGRTLRLGFVALGALALAFTVVPRALAAPDLARAAGHGGEMLAALLAALACTLARRQESPERARVFVALAGAALLWAGAQVVFGVAALGGGPPLSLPSGGDALALAASLLALVGASLLHRSVSSVRWLRVLLDGALLGASLLAISYSLVLVRLFQTHHGVLAKITGLAYPVIDMAIASVALGLLVQRGWRNRTRISLLVGGLVTSAVADTASLYVREFGPSGGFGYLAEAAAVAGLVLVGLGALWPGDVVLAAPARRADPSAAALEPSGHGPGWPDPRWQIGLPYVLFLGGLAAIVEQCVARREVAPFLALDALVMVLAVLVRQVLVLIENASLTETLRDALRALRSDEQELARLARHDPLTGLGNRLLFAEQLEAMLTTPPFERRYLAVIYCDLDDFGDLNDSLGHSTGDSALVEVAQRLRRCIRPTDTVARLGGDEFAVVLADLAEPADASTAARRIVDTIRAPMELDGEQIELRTSVGVAVRTGGEFNLDELLRDADVALYAAKAAGGDAFRVFDPELGARHVERLRTQAELVLAGERGQLRVEYQPVFDLEHGRVLGVEALLRWEHPVRGRLLPGSFLALAEESGSIAAVGAHVLRSAVAQVERWKREGVVAEDFFVAVNLSARQLEHEGLLEVVEQALAASGGSGTSLCLELTESAFFDSTEKTLGVLEALRALGLRLEIDDFGTGYSSLGYLKELPIDALKIDRSFVTGIAEDTYDREIVIAILHIAHALGIEVIAEGIERSEQLDALVALGCSRGQGFLLSRPLPAPAFADLYGSTAPTVGWHLPWDEPGASADPDPWQ